MEIVRGFGLMTSVEGCMMASALVFEIRQKQ